MTRDAFIEKFKDVILRFYEYDSGAVIYTKEFPNGDILLKRIFYGDEIGGISFHRDEVRRLTDIEPYPCEVSYFPHDNSSGNIDFSF